MEKQEAIGIISNVCSSFKGSLSEHTLIQTALKVLTPKEDKVDDIKKKV